jgi:hypothetical protein
VEWCLDWFAPYPDGKAIDPRGPKEGIYKVLRGNAYYLLYAGRSAARYKLREGEGAYI